MMKDEIELQIDYPANIANMLINDAIDIGLIPVAAIPKLQQHHIISDYCIAADGAVASVCLFSQVPVEAVTDILLDYQSRTSAALLKILCAEHWKISPRFRDADPGYINEINRTTAGLIIGDRALKHKENFSYVYDLSSAWKELTGLPFVFAAWVSNKMITGDFQENFNATNQHGFDNLEKVIEENPCDFCNLQEYYTKNIKYKLDEEKRNGLNAFLSRL